MESFFEYLNNEKFSDFTLVCTDKVEIPVHRVILAQKSQVFAKMFDIDMCEKTDMKAQLGDINSKTMLEVLRFIYTGQSILNCVNLASSVLYAAEKYHLYELKCQSIAALIEKVNKDTVLDILKVADIFIEVELEEKCLSIILA